MLYHCLLFSIVKPIDYYDKLFQKTCKTYHYHTIPKIGNDLNLKFFMHIAIKFLNNCATFALKFELFLDDKRMLAINELKFETCTLKRMKKKKKNSTLVNLISKIKSTFSS